MTRMTIGRRQRLALGATALIAIGAAGGAGAVALTRPSIEMAPTNVTPIARLGSSDGIVTVKGRVAEVFGDRFVVQDGSGRAMIDAGRNAGSIVKGSAMTVQGRYDDGQLRARFLVDPAGQVREVGPAHGPHGPRGPHGPGKPGGPDGSGGPRGDGPPPPPPADGRGTPPPPLAAGAPAAAPAGAPPSAGAPAATPAR
ncbi:hypothetical protein [Sphingomonas sp. Leaf37]|uniref:hypothetical protein n=1 Tax=Sphingomonas sp. Leaf37 TaxID=2876552 RepID=UPI001E49811E|nr:hypothetical protein [Sphingomonas sp. Leaf37]